jgi:hypothetical protein
MIAIQGHGFLQNDPINCFQQLATDIRPPANEIQDKNAVFF